MSESTWVKVTNTTTGVVQFFDISETPTFRAWSGAVFSLVDIDGLPLDVQGLTVTQRRNELVLKVDDEEVANILRFFDPGSQSSFHAIRSGEDWSVGSSDGNELAQGASRIEMISSASPADRAEDDAGMSTAMKIGIGLGAGAGLGLGLAGGGEDSGDSGGSPEAEPPAPVGANPDPSPDPDPGLDPGPMPGETVEPVPEESARAVDMTLVAGPLVSGHGLSVEFFDDQGNLLGTSEVDVSGRASLEVGDYTGVIIVKSVDADAGADYLDEATGVAVDLTSVFHAVGVATEDDASVSLNINPVSSVAYAKAIELAGKDPLNGGGSLEVETVQAANEAVASAFGLTDLHRVEIVTVNGDTSYDDVDGISVGERYGEVLAALSGMDANAGGDSQATIDTLIAGLVIAADGQSASFNSEVVRAIDEGSATADAVTGLQTEGLITAGTGPTVLGVEFLIDPTVGTLAAEGEVIVYLKISESVIVFGTPGILLDVGGESVPATYVSGSSTQVLSFVYKVEPGVNDSDGVSVNANALELNGGSIVSADDGKALVAQFDALNAVGPMIDTQADITISPIGESDTLNAAASPNGTIAIAGTVTGVEDGRLVTVELDGRSTTAEVVDGAWSTSAMNVSDVNGELTITASVADAAGNIANASRDVQVDLSAPTVSIDPVGEAGLVINASMAKDGITVSGTTEGIEDGGEVVLLIGEQRLSAEVMNGVWLIDGIDVFGLDGVTVLTANVADVAGITANASREVKVDLIAPEIVINEIGAYDETFDAYVLDAAEVAGGVTVSGTATGSENSTIELIVEGEKIGSALVGADGQWVATNVNVGAEERSAEVLAQVSDTAGNRAETSTFVRVNVDTVALSMDPIGDFDQESEQYVIDTDAYIEGVSVSGLASGAEGQTLSLFVNGNLAGTALVAEDGSWSVPNADVGLVSGSLAVTARVTDAAGFESDTGTLVRLELNPLLIDTVGENGHIDAREYLDGTTISGLALGSDGQTVELLIDGIVAGSAVVKTDGRWSVEGVDLGSEKRSLTLAANLSDSTGEIINASAFVNVYVPRVSLYVNSIGADNSLDTIREASAVTISGLSREAEGLTVEIVVDGVTLGSAEVGADGRWSVESVDLSDATGTRTVTAEVTDVLGKEWSASRTVEVELELQVQIEIEPISEDNRIDGVEARDGVTVSGRAAGAEGLILELAVGDTSVGIAEVAGDGSWSVEGVVFDGSAGAFHEVTASVTDAAGSRTDTEVGVFVDTGLITIEPIGLLNNNDAREVDGTDTGSVTLGGLAVGAEGQMLELFVNGELAATALVSNDGRWTIDGVDLGADPGARKVTANVTDMTGMVLNASASVTVIEGASPVSMDVYDDGDRFGEIDSVEEAANATISGDGLAGLELEVFVDEVSAGTTVADEYGGWSIEGVNLGEQDGSRAVRLEVTDVLGNRWSSSRSVEVGIDNIVPTEPVDLDFDLSDLEVVFDEIGEDGRVDARDVVDGATISGLALGAEGLTVDLLVDSIAAGTAAVDADGRWSIERVDLGSEYSSRTLTASITSSEGESISASGYVTVDVPQVSIYVDSIGRDGTLESINDASEVRISGQSSEAEGLDVEIKVDGAIVGKALIGEDGRWSVESVDLSNAAGSRTVTAEVTDVLGNEWSSSRMVEIELSLEVRIDPVGENNRIGAVEAHEGVTVSGRAAGAEGQILELTSDDAVLGTALVAGDGSWLIEGVVLDVLPVGFRGTEVEASVTDAAGRRSDTEIFFDVDTKLVNIDPIGLGGYSEVDSTDTGAVTIAGLAVDAVGQTLQLFVDDQLAGTTVVGADSRWSVEGVDLRTDPGYRKVTASVTDLSGTALSASESVTVSEGVSTVIILVEGAEDKNLGYGSIDNVEETYDATIAGFSVERERSYLEGLEIDVFLDGVSVGTTVADESGNWSIRGVDLGQQDGNRTIRVEVTDELGNRWTSSRTIELDIDNAVPMDSIDSETAFTDTELVIDEIGENGRVDARDIVDGATIGGRAFGAERLTVELLVDGIAAGTAVVDAEGRWSIEGVDLGSEERSRTLTASFTTSEGETISTSSFVNVDVPQLSITINPIGGDGTLDFIIDASEARISGWSSESEGLTVRIVVDGVTRGTGVVAENGLWLVENVDLSDVSGTRTVTAEVTDVLGKRWSSSRTVEVDIDVSSVIVEIDPVSERNRIDAFEAREGVMISGRAAGAEGWTLELLSGETVLGIVEVAGDGSWSIEGVVLEGLADSFESFVIEEGNYDVYDRYGVTRLSARVTDVTGGRSDADVTVYANTRLLVIESVSLDNRIDAVEARDGVTIFGRAAVDEGQTVELTSGDTMLGSAVVAGDGSWSVEGVVLEGLPVGYWATEVEASVADADGGRSDTLVEVYVDTKLVTIEPIGLADGYRSEVDSTDTSAVAIAGLALGAEGQQLELMVDGELAGTTVVGMDSRWTVEGVDLGSDPGERQVTIDVTDTSGTVLSAARWLTVSEASSWLDISVSGDSGYQSIDTVEEAYGVTISGKSNDNLRGLQLEVFVDGELVGTTVADEDGNWLIEGVDLGEQDGNRTIRVEVTDELGNEWTSSRTVEVDIDNAKTTGSANPDPMAFMFDDELAVAPDGVLDFLSADEGSAVSDSSFTMATRSKLVESLDVDTAIALVDHETTSVPAFDDAEDVGFDLYTFATQTDDIPLAITDYH